MDMRVDGAGRQNLAFARDGLGAGADHDIDIGLDIRIAGLADRRHAPVLEPDIGLHDAAVIEDEGIGDHGVHGACGAASLRLAHAVADHLAAAELHLLAIGREVALDLDDELGVGEPDPVADRRPEHIRVSGTAHATRHVILGPMRP